MSESTSFKPPRKKLSIFWWLGGFVLLLLLLFVAQLFAPNPAIVVSPRTTHVTGTLGPDGLPDFDRVVRDMYRKGVTPENNAAALLWPALWPGELDPKDYAAVAAELGLKQIPSKNDAVTNFYGEPFVEQLAAWLKSRDPATTKALAAAGQDEFLSDNLYSDAANKLVDRAMSRPWTSKQVPPLAKWVATNQKPLDRMVEASGRSRCYFPSPSLLGSQHGSLVEMLLPGAQAVRSAGRSLAARAMWNVGEKHPEAAWRDVLATHRIGRLTAQGQTIVEQLVGIAIDGIAHESAIALLDQGDLTVEQARQIQHDLATLQDFNGIADAMDSMERLMYVDSIIRLGTRKGSGSSQNFGMPKELQYLDYVRVNWNVALEEGNEFYDRLVAAARLPSRQERQQAFARFDAELNQIASQVREPSSLVAGVINPATRSELVADTMISVFLPAITAAMEAQDRANVELALERLGAALAVHRAEHGAYPNKLEELVPGVINKLPVDLYNAKPFIYKRTADGYLLYSTGDNGTDEGGSNEMREVFEGRELPELDEAEAEKLRPKIPRGADDISIRLPRPRFEIPKARVAPANGGGP